MAEKPDLNAALHKAADRKSRRTAVRAALFLGLALVAAVGSALLLTRWMESRMAAARVPTGVVLVAALELPVGTELRAEHLKAVDWPLASRPAGTFREAKELVGKVVSVRMVKEEPFLAVKLAGDQSGTGLSALLAPGMRALAVRVDDVVGVAGFLHPGDSVDVIATLKPEGGHGATSSKVILQDIRVLAVGKELDNRPRSGDKVVPATVATLMVDSEQSERLALAATQGKILLTLRSGADREVVSTRGVTPMTLLAGDGGPVLASTTARRAARARPAAVEEPARPPETVEILRGDLFEKRDFQKKEAKR